MPDESDARSGGTVRADAKFGSGEALGEIGAEAGALDGLRDGEPK